MMDGRTVCVAMWVVRNPYRVAKLLKRLVEVPAFALLEPELVTVWAEASTNERERLGI